jgi:hypothetical protein
VFSKHNPKLEILGCDNPHENLIQEKPSHGSLDENVGKTTFATHTSCPVSPMAKHHLTHDSFEEVKFVPPFDSPKLVCETKRIPSPSLEPKSCPPGHLNVVLDNDRDSTLILHERFWAMDKLEAPTLELDMNDSTNEHESSSFEFPHISCSLLMSLESITLSTPCPYEDSNLLIILVSKLFRRMVVDAYIYHK